MVEFDRYKLQKWAKCVKERDGKLCFMCKNETGHFNLNSHHIYPKKDERYTKKIYKLDNGITLCWNCHRNVVHSTWTNWRKYCVMFRAYMRRKKIREFNKINQNELD